MPALPELDLSKSAMVVYYGPASRDHLEAIIRNLGVEVYAIAGRAPHALEEIRKHPVKVVVIDSEPQDISISLAIRQIGRTLPDSLIITARADRPTAEIYQGGRQIAVAENLEAAFSCYAMIPGPVV